MTGQSIGPPSPATGWGLAISPVVCPVDFQSRVRPFRLMADVPLVEGGFVVGEGGGGGAES